MADDIETETVKKENSAAEFHADAAFFNEPITDGSHDDPNDTFDDLKPPTRAQETLRLMQAADVPRDPAAAKVNKAYSQYRTDYLQGVEAGRAEGQQQAVRYAFAWIETVYGIGHAERYLAAWNAA